MSKNRMTLMSFVNFCATNPEMRFWQALAAWSGFTIFTGPTNVSADVIARRAGDMIRDTFNWEGHRE